MSKRAKVYVLYTKLSNDTNAAYNLGQGTGVVNSKGAGAGPSAWSFGMRHTF